MKKIVIIGGGLGGLVSGALLSKQGFEVTLVEQHNIVGGCATTFKRKGGFTCEVGLHEMDGLYTDKSKKAIFKELGVYQNVEFVKPNEFFQVKAKNIDFIMPDNIDDAKEKLKKRFSNESRAIDTYFNLIETIAFKIEKLSNMKIVDFLFFPLKYWTILKYKNSSVSKVFHSLFKNEDLKLILNANIGYYHDNIDELSFLLHAIAQYSYFNGQGWFIKGGSRRLSDYLASIIIENNGKVLTKSNVINIDVKRKQLTYINKKQQEVISYNKLISNISPADTYSLANIAYKEEQQIANSILTVYIGFNKNIKSVYGSKSYSTFLLKDISSINEYNESVNCKIEERGFVFVDYSQIDSGLTSDEKSFGVLCTSDKLSDWEALDKEEYKKKKEQIIESYLIELQKHYPNIKEYIEFIEVATAKTMQRYLKTPNATAYGYAPTYKQFFKRPKCKSDKVEDLYFVGQWVFGGGFSPSINSGKFAANEIIEFYN